MTGDGDPAERLREHLVETAATLLAERHASAVTTREIARAAGVSDGVLYNYFAGKQDLVAAGLVRRFERLVPSAAAALPAPGSGTVADNLVDLAVAVHDLVRDALPMIAGLVTDPPMLRRVLDGIHRPGQGILPLLNRIGEYLVEEQRLGRVAPGTDLQATMLLLTGACATLTLRSHLLLDMDAAAGGAPVPDDAREELARVVRVLVDGIT